MNCVGAFFIVSMALHILLQKMCALFQAFCHNIYRLPCKCIAVRCNIVEKTTCQPNMISVWGADLSVTRASVKSAKS
jgi:hypothetical protein